MLIQKPVNDDLYEVIKEAERLRKQHLQNVKEGTQWVGKDTVLLNADSPKIGNPLNESVVMKSSYFEGTED
jgi:hypothetical protein